MFHVLISRALQRAKRPFVFNEDDSIYRAVRHISAGVAFDVGAHYGGWHQRYAKRGWTVYAFEPDPDNRARIPVSERVIVSSNAISETALEAAAFFASEESTGISSLSAFTCGHRPRATVRVSTLRDEIARRGVTRCDVLKIDTEGHDLFVLRGFPWEQIQPSAVMCEFEDRKTIPLGYTYRELGDFLLARGYAVFLSEWAPIVRYGITHTWRRVVPYPVAVLEPGAWGNFLAFRQPARMPWILWRHKWSETGQSPKP